MSCTSLVSMGSRYAIVLPVPVCACTSREPRERAFSNTANTLYNYLVEKFNECTYARSNTCDSIILAMYEQRKQLIKKKTKYLLFLNFSGLRDALIA